MRKRGIQALITVIVMSAFVVTPVFAEPGVEELEQEKNEAQAAADQVSGQLVNLLVQFDALKKDMENQGNKINQAETELTEAQKKEQEQYEDMKLRIKYMYEAGETSFFETLITAKSYADLVNKAEYVQKIHSYDRKKLKEYIETKDEVAALKSDLESGQSEMEVMAKDYESQESNLQATLADMRSRVSDFDSQLEAAKTAAESQMAQLSAQTEAIVAAGGSQASTGNSGSGGSSGNQKPSNNQGGSGSSSGGSSAGSSSSGSSSSGGSSSGGSSSGGSSSGDSSSGGSSSSVTPDNSGTGQAIANMGLSYAGKLSYVYGGTSLVTGADCSGFTQSIHRQYGISIPRTAEDQWAGWGKTVSYSQILPGDLVCYSSHVGIYIGGGKIVHASNPTDGVKVSNMNYRQWLGIKRYW